MSPDPGYHHRKLRVPMEVCMEARLAYESGESLKDIGLRLGLSSTAVRNRIRIAGGSLRDHRESGKMWAQRKGYKGPQIPQEELWNWKGGRTTQKGYVAVLAKDHPRVPSHGYMPEHVLVAEKMIGRYLRHDEVVHHRNGIKTDNRPDNLEVMTRAEHMRHHLHSAG